VADEMLSLLKCRFRVIADLTEMLCRGGDDYWSEPVKDNFKYEIWRYCVYLDWFLNKQDPHGRRILKDKAKLIRGMLNRRCKCFRGLKDRSICDRCEHKFRCWTDSRWTEVVELIEEQCSQQIVNSTKKRLAPHTISEDEYEERKRMLQKHLNIRLPK
jgi:hypothetical protein